MISLKFTTPTIRTELSFADELDYLIELTKSLGLKRYGDSLYIKKSGNPLKHTFTLKEFVWGHCQNPCIANRLYEEIDKCLDDCKRYLSILARANKKVGYENLYETVEDCLYDTPENHINYTIETSQEWNNNTILAESNGADIWNGFIFTDKVLARMESLQIQLNTKDSVGVEWGRVYEWSGNEIVQNCRSLFEDNDEYDENSGETDWYIFTPFKHPLILKNVDVQTIVTVQFYSSYEVDSEDIKLIFGVCSDDFREWLENEKFKLELAYGDKYIVDLQDGIIDRSK